MSVGGMTNEELLQMLFHEQMKSQAHEMLFRWLFEERALDKGLDAQESGDEVRRVASSLFGSQRRGFKGEEMMIQGVHDALQSFADGLQNRMEKYG